MNGAEVDTFSAKLSRELEALSWQDRNEKLIEIGRQEQRMRASGQERPVWRGPAPEDKLLGVDVVVPTDQGERRGRVICYGIIGVGQEYERSVIIHVPSSGTHHEAPGSQVRLASPEDTERMRNEEAMAQRLREAAVAVQKGPTPLPELAVKKRRGEKDPKLIAEFIRLANAHGNVRSVEEGGANFKVTGLDQSKRLYVFKNQLRVDVSGFSFDHKGLRRISDQEARDMHLGKVRGQILFDDRAEALSAFSAALDNMK